jgi:hypothetical protein
MAWGDGKASRHGREQVPRSLPVPPGLSRSTLKLTVLEDELRVAPIGRVASHALIGGKLRAPTPPVASGFPNARATLDCARAPVAQLDRAPGFEPGGRRFESVRARFSIKKLPIINVPTVAKT